MLKYIIRRIIAMIPVVIGITFLVFMIMQLAPGDPVQMILGDNASPEAVEAMRDEMGLNDNVLIQYGRYLVNLAHVMRVDRDTLILDTDESIPVSRRYYSDFMARYVESLK